MKKIAIVTVFVLLTVALIFCVNLIIKQNNKLQTLQETISSQDKTISELKTEVEVLNLKANIHPIEKAVKECMKKANYTTYGMSECVDNSVDDWYKEIDKYLSLLKEKLPKNKYDLIMTSQKKWEDYKKAEWETLNAIIGEKMGTIYINILSSDRAAIIERRARDLDELYFHLTE